jgi:dihydrofolate reductase
MIVSLIAAFDQQGGIGWKGNLPLRLTTDLRRFKQLTMGHHLVMGRKTWESIGRALPGRTSIVLSRDPHFSATGAIWAVTFEEAVAIARERGESELFVIGGSEVFSASLPSAERLYLTEVQAVVPVDAFFPPFDMSEWQELERQEVHAGAGNEYASVFRILERRHS